MGASPGEVGARSVAQAVEDDHAGGPASEEAAHEGGRRQRLDRLLNRVSPALDPLTPACLGTSLTLWQKVASDPDWRESSLPWLSRQATWADGV